MKRIAWLVAVMCVLGSQPVWAARTRVHEAAESPQYGRKCGGMIGRGVLNVATSFVDILVNVVNETKAGPPLVGTLTGVAKGTGCGVLRLGSGAVDLLTFWVPGFNGLPVSDSYDNCFATSSQAAVLGEIAPDYPEQAAPSTWSVSTPAAETSGTSLQSESTMPRETPVKKIWKK